MSVKLSTANFGAYQKEKRAEFNAVQYASQVTLPTSSVLYDIKN